MTDYTNAKNWPAYITNNMSDKKLKFVRLNGELHPYAIVREGAFPQAPKGFIGCHPNTQFFFISNEVPERFRDLFVAHEVYEYALEGGPDGKGNCLKALFYELSLIPENIRKEYLPYRRDFFARMVAFYEGNDEFYTRRNNIRESFKYLKSIEASDG